MLESALASVTTLIRPSDNVYDLELVERYRSVRGYLPAVLKYLRFEAGPAGESVVAAFNWLRDNHLRTKPTDDAPREVISKSWQRYVVREEGICNEALDENIDEECQIKRFKYSELNEQLQF